MSLGNCRNFKLNLLYIPCKKIEECYLKNKVFKRCARGLSIFTVYLIIILILFILVNVILPPIVLSITDLLNHLPGYYNTIRNLISNLPEDSFLVKINAQEIINKIAKITSGIVWHLSALHNSLVKSNKAVF
mgnify:CR=1 FL=1